MDLPGSVMMSLEGRLDSTTLLDVNAGLRVADQTRLGTETTTSWYRRCCLLVGPSGKSASPLDTSCFTRGSRRQREQAQINTNANAARVSGSI